MQSHDTVEGPVIRLFEVQVKPGRAKELLRQFATTSADVVRHEPGNEGYFFGRGVATDEDVVVFASVWKDLDAVKERFGENWQRSYLPPGYDDMIDACSVRHIDVGAGWHVKAGG